MRLINFINTNFNIKYRGMKVKNNRSNTEYSPEQHYFKQILRGIDKIQSTILQKLEHCDIQQTPKYNHSKRHDTPKARSTHRFTLCPNSQRVNKSRIAENNPEIMKHSTTIELNKNVKKLRLVDVNITPRRNRKKSPNNITSPFYDNAFDQVETIRKIGQSRKIDVKNKENRENKDKFEINESTLWQKWREVNYKQRSKQMRNINSKAILRENEIERYYNKECNRLVLEEAALKLEQQFENCLMAKREAEQAQKLILRERMTDISIRIAKIRQRQLKM